MISLSLSNERLSIKRVEFSQLPRLLEWYNMVEDYSYATGLDSPVTMDELGRIYFNAVNNEEDVFVGIHSNYAGEMVGILKGKISNGIFWIYIMITDRDYQAMGYGTSAISMLLEHLKDYAGIREVFLAVADENLKGRSFWRKNGFMEVGKAESDTILKGRGCKAIIMQKKICK